MARKPEVSAVGEVSGKPLKSKGNRYASKKAYFARNTNGAISKKNKARRAAAAAKRKAYWDTLPGRARKEAKMNTPEKVKARAAAKVSQKERRRQRMLEEQKVARENVLKNENQN